MDLSHGHSRKIVIGKELSLPNMDIVALQETRIAEETLSRRKIMFLLFCLFLFLVLFRC